MFFYYNLKKNKKQKTNLTINLSIKKEAQNNVLEHKQLL